MPQSFIRIFFSRIERLPSSLSASLLEVTATGCPEIPLRRGSVLWVPASRGVGQRVLYSLVGSAVAWQRSDVKQDGDTLGAGRFMCIYLRGFGFLLGLLSWCCSGGSGAAFRRGAGWRSFPYCVFINDNVLSFIVLMTVL